MVLSCFLETAVYQVYRALEHAPAQAMDKGVLRII
jgi:hypothetical protein